MNKLLNLAVVLVILSGLVGCTEFNPMNTSQPVNIPTQDAAYLSSEGFQRVKPGMELEFPKDHGAHPDYQTEWWYYTGNLWTPEGREFGYQLTFFRRALSPQSDQKIEPSQWTTNQVYMGHFAIVDVAGSNFSAFERFERGAVGLAGAEVNPYFSVWLRNWRVDQIDPGTYKMQAEEGNIRITLQLLDRKGIVLQGIDGYSQKGPEEGNASYYSSLTRLESKGEIKFGEKVYPVTGYSWMDHEYGTSALGNDQVGWDWFAIQMEDGSELMVYIIRNSKGEVDKFSRGIFIDPEKKVAHLDVNDFQIVVKNQWKSEKSGAIYPSEWEISVPRVNLAISVKPKIPNQELLVSFIYWEGAVSVSGTRNNTLIKGWGYAELTGYAISMQGRF